MKKLLVLLFLGSTCLCCLDADYDTAIAVGIDIKSIDQCSLNIALMNAIQVGDLENVKTLVGHGADVNAIIERPEDSIKIRPILLAVRKPEILEFLISEEADINVHFGARQTLLHIAAQNGEDAYAALCLLLQYGADVNAVDLYGRTPLNRCMHFKQNALVLMEYGANIHIRDYQGWNPLHRGYQKLDIDFLRKFVEMGASLDEFTPDGKNALHYACHMGSQSNSHKIKKMELLRFLIEEQKMSVNKHSNWWDGETGDLTPFMLAIASGGNFEDEDFKELEYLLAHGADMNTQIFHVTLGGIRYVLHNSVLAWASGCTLPHVLLWLKGVALRTSAGSGVPKTT